MIGEDHFTYWTVDALRHLLYAAGLVVDSARCVGIGRDLVAPVDRLVSWTRRRAAERPLTSRESHEAAAVWSARPWVTMLEDAANVFLTRTMLGVSIELTASVGGIPASERLC
jgi:hypothetical protein